MGRRAHSREAIRENIRQPYSRPEDDSGHSMHPITVVSKGSSRAAYRVVPDPDDPVILLLEGQLCRVLDISASGFSCPQGEIKAGRRYSFRLDLPTSVPAINGMVDVLPKRDNGNLHCRFVDLAAEEMDYLHHYVLIRQKEAIRGLKRRTPSRY